jgi:hypothetical protein
MPRQLANRISAKIGTDLISAFSVKPQCPLCLCEAQSNFNLVTTPKSFLLTAIPDGDRLRAAIRFFFLISFRYERLTSFACDSHRLASRQRLHLSISQESARFRTLAPT